MPPTSSPPTKTPGTTENTTTPCDDPEGCMPRICQPGDPTCESTTPTPTTSTTMTTETTTTTLPSTMSSTTTAPTTTTTEVKTVVGFTGPIRRHSNQCCQRLGLFCPSTRYRIQNSFIFRKIEFMRVTLYAELEF